MSKRIFLLLLIFIISFTLRYWKIAEFPKTLYGDEQAFAWNAFNILKTGTDEYGTPYPLQFRSFDDYKAPLPVYLLVPVFKIFGMNIWSIRFPVVVFSFLTVVIFYYLLRIFFSYKISLLSLFFFAISPWHIHLSRGYFEAVISLFFFLTGIYAFFKYKRNITGAVLTALFFNFSIYSYFTPRILLLLFTPFLLFMGFKNFFSDINKRVIFKYLTVFISLLFIFSLPLLYATFFDRGLSRFNKLNESMGNTVSSAVNRERSASRLPAKISPLLHNKFSIWLRLVKNNYFEHLSINFWYLYGDNSLRYFLGNMGMFYLFEMPFFILGIIYLFRYKKTCAIFMLGWILLAPFPAAIVGRSFAVRSLSMLPAPFVFVGSGIYYFSSKLRSKFKNIFILGFTAVVVSYLSHLLVIYYLEYPVYAATWWGWENKAAFDYAKVRQTKYDNIFVSDYYTGAPLAFAVYNSLDPKDYRQAISHPVTVADDRKLIKIGKYYFGSLDLDNARLSQKFLPPKSLYLGRPEEADSDITINAPDDGRIIFKIYDTP